MKQFSEFLQMKLCNFVEPISPSQHQPPFSNVSIKEIWTIF